tara:strand:+ start:2045 stop:2464 length:420 start_codon:yes stop_codon:yes gene_type:complete
MTEELRSENNKIAAYEMILDEIKNGDAFEYARQLLGAEGMLELENLIPKIAKPQLFELHNVAVGLLEWGLVVAEDHMETAFEESFPDLSNDEWRDAMQEAASLADSMIPAVKVLAQENPPIKEDCPERQKIERLKRSGY